MTWKPLFLLENSNKTEICLSQKHASLFHKPLITQTVLPVLVNIYIYMGGADIHTQTFGPATLCPATACEESSSVH